MSVGYTSEPSLDYGHLLGTVEPGLAVGFDEDDPEGKESFSLFDGQNYLWVYNTNGVATYERYGGNDESDILEFLSEEYGVEFIGEEEFLEDNEEYDEYTDVYDDDEEENEESGITVLTSQVAWASNPDIDYQDLMLADIPGLETKFYDFDPKGEDSFFLSDGQNFLRVDRTNHGTASCSNSVAVDVSNIISILEEEYGAKFISDREKGYADVFYRDVLD